MWIFLACLIGPDSWSVAMYNDSIVLLSGSLAVMVFEIMTGSIVLVAFLVRCIFAPESLIGSVFLLGEFGGVPIQFIKLILGLLISTLFIIAPNRHPCPFPLTPSLFL